MKLLNLFTFFCIYSILIFLYQISCFSNNTNDLTINKDALDFLITNNDAFDSLFDDKLTEFSELDSLLPKSDVSFQEKVDLIFNSRNINDWITNIENNKGIIDNIPTSEIESRLSTLLTGLNDLKKLMATLPIYVTTQFLENKGLDLIQTISDIRLFKEIFNDNSLDTLLLIKGFELIGSVPDAIELKNIFPKNNQIEKLDLKAFSMIKSLEDIKLYLDNFKLSINKKNLSKLSIKYINSAEDIVKINQIFPGFAVVDEAIDKLFNKLTNSEIINIIDSIPFNGKMSKLEDKYFSNIRNLDEAIIALDKFPDNIEDISKKAVRFCTTIADYRKYLSYFGDTETAFDIRKKYYNLTSKVPENLGKNVNSIYGDYAPVITPDGETLYFCRRNSEDLSNDEDIYYTQVESMDEWGIAKNIGPPLNNSKHNAVSGVSQDGGMLLLHNHYNDDDAGLSVSYKTPDGWSIPVDIEIPNFYNNSEYHNACLSADGKTIMISSARNDSYGGNDIYVIRQDKDGKWLEPMNIGPTINTWGEESSIFLAADGVTIYFSSDGHEGFGGSDIFMSRRLDNSWLKWSKPENLGEKINTSASERYYVIPASGDFVYFSSYNNSLGQSDIFRIGLPLDKRPNPVVLVTGRVIDNKTNKPVSAKVYYEDLETGETLGSVISNPQIGNYKIILPGGKKYGFRAESEGFLPVNENVDLTNLKNYKKSMRDLKIVPFEKGQSLVINNIFFDTGKASLKKQSCFELDRLVQYMNENPKLTIEVSGHTDDVGADDMNMRLSKRRAESVCNYLFKNGIAKERLQSFGFGETMPIVPNNSASNRSKNRRVEIKFI